MASPVNVREKLGQIAAERILILDGAMGSMIQAYRSPQGYPLSEDDFRGVTEGGKEGGRFRDHPVPLRGCNDLLCLTQPRLISGIHEAYLEAGADIIETCSFNATSISLADYGLGDAAYELSAAAAATRTAILRAINIALFIRVLYRFRRVCKAGSGAAPSRSRAPVEKQHFPTRSPANFRGTG